MFKVYWFRGPDLVAFESNLVPSCSPKVFPTQVSPNINEKRHPVADQICSGIVIGLGTLCDQFRFEVGRERIFHTYANTFALFSARWRPCLHYVAFGLKRHNSQVLTSWSCPAFCFHRRTFGGRAWTKNTSSQRHELKGHPTVQGQTNFLTLLYRL